MHANYAGLNEPLGAWLGQRTLNVRGSISLYSFNLQFDSFAFCSFTRYIQLTAHFSWMLKEQKKSNE